MCWSEEEGCVNGVYVCERRKKEKNVYSTCLYGRSGCFPMFYRLCVAVGCVVEMCLGVLLFMLVCLLASKGRRMRFFSFTRRMVVNRV